MRFKAYPLLDTSGEVLLEGESGVVQPDRQHAVVSRTGEGVCTLEDIELRHIRGVLKQHEGNRRKVARALGVSARTLYRKLKSYHLS